MNENKNAIGRFAPSPSGIMHLGNIASALLAWLDARSRGGKIVLRIEDLDPDRCSNELAVKIAEGFKSLGLVWDSGWENKPSDKYAQSNRTELYNDIFDILQKRDAVYPCYCTRNQRLAASAPHQADKLSDFGCKCRYLSKLERRELEKAGRKPAWKIKAPDKIVSFTDGHYGKFSENLSDTGDFIIKRSDGVFAYQLAVSFDDMDMGVNRVVRGRDLISSTARQIWLIEELGGKAPQYCHAPLLTALDKRKLSKRDGDLNIDELTKRFSTEEIFGLLSSYLNISDGKPTSAEGLIEGFDWSKVPKEDIVIK